MVSIEMYRYHLNQLKQNVEYLISATPSGDNRNMLADINIKIMEKETIMLQDLERFKAAIEIAG